MYKIGGLFQFNYILEMKIYIDEAGRWPLAWPVQVGLVYCREKSDMSSYRDSKQLNPTQRQYLYDNLLSNDCVVISTGVASASEIDRYGIIWALHKAVLRGLQWLFYYIDGKKYTIPIMVGILRERGAHICLDGNHDFALSKKLGIHIETIIKGDSLVSEISAASIIAKVSRDSYMTRLHKKFPQYGFDRHKGYGTSAHCRAIKTYGLSILHRKSFCSKFL
jgi:ribonuclease HII